MSDSTNTKKNKLSVYGLFIWSLAALFFFFEFFLRVFLGTISSEIIDTFHLTAESFSALGAGYYLTYSIMQLPVGILVDRFGVKALLTFASGVCTLSVFWFAIAHSFFPLFLSRLLMGFGSSFAFVSLLFISLNWFDHKRFGLFTGLSQFLGSVGPLLAGAPLALAMSATNNNWRLILLILGVFGIGLTFLILLFVKNKPKGREKKVIYLKPHTPLSSRLKDLFSKKQIYSIILFASFVYGAIPLIGAYWGTMFLQSRGFPNYEAAFIVSMIWLGLSIGSLIIGKFSDGWKRRKSPLVLYALVGLISSCFILYYPSHNEILLIILFFFLGFGSSAQSLTFALITDNVSTELKGTALGLNNALIILFGAIIPYFASSLLAFFGTKFQAYSYLSFVYSLSIMPIMFLIALILSIFLIKETFCRQQDQLHHIKK